MLGCGHVFCQPCVAMHFTVQAHAGRAVSCPNCKREVPPEELATNFSEDISIAMAVRSIAMAVRSGGLEDPTDATNGELAPLDTATRRAYQRFARAAHLKVCPSCGAHIAKAGGCDHMSCRCGHRFNWSQARTVVPCRTLHWEIGKLTICRGCSPVARAKWAFAQLGMTTLVKAPLVGFGAAGVAAFAALSVAAMTSTAAVFGPPALIVEPFRRLLERKQHRKIKNWFAMAAASGAIIPASVLFACCQDEDD